MEFIIIEIQTGETVTTIVNQFAARAEAEQRYHAALSSAAVSAVPVHSVVMLTAAGVWLKSESYKHTPPVQADAETAE